MSDTKNNSETKKDEHCIECPAGFDECLDCGACDHCDHNAVLDESDLPPNWLNFIQKNTSKS